MKNEKEVLKENYLDADDEQYLFLKKHGFKLTEEYNLVWDMDKYRDKLLNAGVGQDVTAEELQNSNDAELKEKLENLFMDYLYDCDFKIIKKLFKQDGWTWDLLLKVHKQNKYKRIMYLLNMGANYYKMEA